MDDLMEQEGEPCADCHHGLGRHDLPAGDTPFYEHFRERGRCFEPDCSCNLFVERKTVVYELSRAEQIARTEIDPQAEDALIFAKELSIRSESDYEVVAHWLTEVQAIRKVIDKTFDPIISAQKAALDQARMSKNYHAKPYEEAVAVAKGKMSAWIELRERQKAEADRLARLEAQKKAEEERRAKAQALAAKGKTEEAKVVASLPVAYVPPASIDQPAVKKVDGISIRKLWKWREVDGGLMHQLTLILTQLSEMAEDRAAAGNLLEKAKTLLSYCVLDEGTVTSVVKALGGETRIAGIEVFQDTNIAGSAR